MIPEVNTKWLLVVAFCIGFLGFARYVVLTSPTGNPFLGLAGFIDAMAWGILAAIGGLTVGFYKHRQEED